MAHYNVDDVLQTMFSDANLKWKPSDKIPLVKKEIDSFKSKLKSFIDSSGFDISQNLSESDDLLRECQDLVDKMVFCRNEIQETTIPKICSTLRSHDMLTRQMKANQFARSLVEDVLMANTFVKLYEDGKLTESFLILVETMMDLLEHLESTSEYFKQLDIYATTKTSAELTLQDLLAELDERWDEMISYNITTEDDLTNVNVTLLIDDSPPNIDSLNALHHSNKLDEKVQDFAQFILNDMLVPIINNYCVVNAETDEHLTITINYKEGCKPKFEYVILNLHLVLEFLSNKLKYELSYTSSLITKIGTLISKDFTDILIRDCLIDTVPNNITELKDYGSITSGIQRFQHFLVIIKFFTDPKLTILSYMKNIDVLFANKSSKYFLNHARTIMVKDLGVTMSIGVENKIEKSEEGAGSSANITEEALGILDKAFPKSVFFFPRCMISKTAQELLDLVYVIMEQAVECSDVVSRKLYVTTRMIFELYQAIVPYHHEKYLQTIPQYVALFHNNCMYLAHSLQTFGDKWLMLMEGRELVYPISFVDIVQDLRDLGCKHLSIHLQQQRRQILDNIRSSDLNCIAGKDVLGDNAEAAIRQCLRQLQLLKNVWIGVFPNNVFTNLMSTLLSMFMDELIHRVCSVEDISMDMATQFTDMYTLVVQKAPTLFQNPNDIEENVKSWIKLQQLIFILSGTLKDIEQQWNDGTGPLAIHFKTDELRNLIKALFQNTQMRANLLAKIK